MNGRAGKTARKLARYRSTMKAQAAALDPTKSAMAAGVYYGSKSDKPDGDRRPHKGGKVHS